MDRPSDPPFGMFRHYAAHTTNETVKSACLAADRNVSCLWDRLKRLRDMSFQEFATLALGMCGAVLGIVPPVLSRLGHPLAADILAIVAGSVAFIVALLQIAEVARTPIVQPTQS